MTEGSRDIIPSSSGLPADRVGHDVVPAPGPAESYRLGTDEVARLTAAVAGSLADMKDIMFATKEQGVTATRAAAVTTAALGEALTADPDAYDATLARYQGPIDRMSDHALRMHQHLTGHHLPEADFRINAPYDRALSVLYAIGSKVVGSGLNYLGAGQTNATAAHARKGIALEAGKALNHIAQTRGAVTVSEETHAAISQFILPPQTGS
jgi:hypothetical protein